MNIRSCFCVRSGTVPFNYLGVPIFYSAPKTCYLKPIADHILTKFVAWKGSTLSMAGRLALINSVVYGSFLHSFMIYKWPVFFSKI